MTRMTYREAVRAALREALATDQRVILVGEDVGRYGGAYACSKGLLAEFGPDRVRDTPLSEAAFTGCGIGAAIGGLRPIVEIMTVNFALLALDQIVNNAATLRHMSGGQVGVPLVIRMATGAGRQVAAQHSHSLEVWFAHVPGLKVLTPATPHDARFMLAAALADPDPVVIVEHALLYPAEGEVDEPGGIEHLAREHPGHRAADPEPADERPGVDAGQAHDVGLRQVVAERAGGGEVARDPARLADDEARHLQLAALDVGGVDPVVADLGRGHREDLAAVGGIGEDLLVAGHRGVETDLAGDGAPGAERVADVDRAVFEGERCACHDPCAPRGGSDIGRSRLAVRWSSSMIPLIAVAPRAATIVRENAPRPRSSVDRATVS